MSDSSWLSMGGKSIETSPNCSMVISAERQMEFSESCEHTALAGVEVASGEEAGTEKAGKACEARPGSI